MNCRYRLLYELICPLLRLLFPTRTRHVERLPEGAMILCAPHSSLIDPFLLAGCLGKRRAAHFMAKKELFDKPLLGSFLRSVGAFPVERGSADIRAIRTTITILKAGGVVGIFPEGTRRQEDGSEARGGAVLVAAQTGAPLVPVWLPRNKRLFRPVEIVFGEPYTLPRMQRRENCRAYAAELMERIYRLREEDGPSCGS